MKTSNKILSGLLVVVFVIPLLMAYSLKSKMRNGDFTIQKDENSENSFLRSGSFTTFKVVKVVAPNPDFLNCHLRLGNDMNYRYFSDNSKDSVKVFTSNDTLYISYVAGKNANQSGGSNSEHFDVNVNLPVFNNLVVDGAVVIIDSLPAASTNLSVILRNNGELKDGSENRVEEKKVSEAKSIKTHKSIEVSETCNAEVKNESGTAKFKTVQEAKLPLLDADVTDLLSHNLFMKI